MQEYQSYKGQYIGPGCFSSRAEVDKYIDDFNKKRGAE